MVDRKPEHVVVASTQKRNLGEQLLEAEAAHYAKKHGDPSEKRHPAGSLKDSSGSALESSGAQDADSEEARDAKRRKVLEETRHVDAESDTSDSDSSEESWV